MGAKILDMQFGRRFCEVFMYGRLVSMILCPNTLSIFGTKVGRQLKYHIYIYEYLVILVMDSDFKW